eukprot:1557536-Amphidinium_carterae.1
MEVHIDDVHGCGAPEDVEIFVAQLQERVALKHSGCIEEGRLYHHLKRPRVSVQEGCWIGTNGKYIDDVLRKLGLASCRLAPTPSACTTGGDDEGLLDLNGVKTYRSSVGSLLYVAIDREDIQWEVSKLARRLREPRQCDLKLLKRVSRYLQGTRGLEVFFDKPPMNSGVTIAGYSDSDWAGDKGDRRSQSSGHVKVDGCSMTGWSSRQATVALSSGEAEYNAAVAVASMMMYYREIYHFFGFQ